ncbi:MAG: vitamin K epoxide reductase family protein, partial [Opitutaceae bacterium]
MTFSIPILLARWLRALGLAVALFLGLMKLAGLPCGVGAGCDAVLSSRYAVLLGIPMGIYGAVLWSVALISPSPASRRWAHHLLGFGSIVMVGLQAFV